MIIHPRSIIRSAALSLALFALAACGSGGVGDSSTPSAPSTAALSVPLDDTTTPATSCEHGGIRVYSGIDENGNGKLDDDEYDAATDFADVCNGAPGTATVIIYFELGQTFTLPEDAAAGDSAGTISAFTSNESDVTFEEADPPSDAFDVSDAGAITLADDVTLDFEAQDTYTVYVKATADDAPDAFSNAHITITDVDEPILPPPFQNGTAEHPYLVDTLAELQSIATGFANDYIATNCFKIINCDRGEISEAASLAANYRQVADIDASPTAAADYNSGAGFLPIGTFSGSYDGGGYLIAGLFIDRSGSDNVGLFSQTSGSGVLENIALVSADVAGKDYTGVLVGRAAGTVRESFASGRLKVDSKSGGLVGDSSGQVEDSFAVVMVDANGTSGGLVGELTESAVLRSSFALGSLSSNVSQTGGLVGPSLGTISHSFATGNVVGTTAGGLVGLNVGSVSDSYATGTPTGTTPGGLLGSGTASRSYRVDSSGSEGTLPAGSSGTREEQLTALRALACDATTEFRWDDDGDDPDGDDLLDDPNTDGDNDPDTNPPGSATAAVACSAANEDAFPWDFGTSADLPVINGLVGGLDAEGQRLAVEFSLVDRAAVTGTIASPATSVDVTLTAPTVGREAGSVLSYFWVLERSTAISADGLRARDVIITATAGTYAAHLTIIERDAAGTLLAVYADEFSLTVTGP